MRTAGMTFLILVLLSTSGCGLFERAQGLSPEQQWAFSSELYISTMKIIVILGKEGVLDRDALLRIDKWRGRARTALNEWKAAVLDGDTRGIVIAMRIFNVAMDELIKERMAGEDKR